jgi:hypothetical protein
MRSLPIAFIMTTGPASRSRSWLMTERIIRPGHTNGQYGHLWSWLLAAAVLLVVLLIIAARIAG